METCKNCGKQIEWKKIGTYSQSSGGGDVLMWATNAKKDAQVCKRRKIVAMLSQVWPHEPLSVE